MKRFYQTFKALPPEFKLVLGFLGLGTMAGLFYLLQRQLGGRNMTLIIVGVAAALVLLVWLVIRLFGWAGRRRAARMDYELSSGGQGGPQSMDVSAKIKANNEKFFKAVRELKKTVGISVYELPWYIVIGDSGCGKTKLVNEGGLTFSTGKPEGYQLGTLDYNWWFTEDAIFVDMAGRLCNPQDDRDRREWMAFLDTIARGRKGYPINGALVCVSTEHLLRDPPEKHESDAHIALERLRDLQSKLGVTFATYLVVTKCDKILGFMQFFDRAERDIAVKNQVFGWSRPGAFNEPYDPENFKGDFGKLYGRLNDLRLRRLNDDVEEIDLGLAYAFPEEFRGLSDPLQTYIRTLFPFIRNPRAVKNLLFRGVYFTSATQEGELILKHLTERLGNEAASQFPPLDDLYPHKRPHFIKDVLMRKVFPEHGLVFRNEQQVVRNRRLSRALLVGTSVLAVLLFSGFVWSVIKYRQIIERPGAWAQKIAADFSGLKAAAAPAQAAEAARFRDQLWENRRSARVLCGIVCSPMEPGESLEKIRAKLVEKVLKGALGEVRDALHKGTGLAGSAQDAAAYQAALAEYVRWYACVGQQGGASHADSIGFETLMGAVKASSPLTKDPKFAAQKDWYFTQAATNSPLKRNPAALLAEADKDPAGTITAAVRHVSNYFKSRYATVSQENVEETVREWMRILQACGQVDATYGAILSTCKATEQDQVATLKELAERQNNFLTAYAGFEKALTELDWKRGAVKPLADALWEQREIWRRYRTTLAEACKICGTATASESLLAGFSEEDLDRAMWDSLRGVRLASIDYSATLFGDKASFVKSVRNVYDVHKHVLTWVPGGEGSPSGTLKLSEDGDTVRSVLRDVNTEWSGTKLREGSCLPDGAPGVWVDALFRHMQPKTPGGQEPEKHPGTEWNPKGLNTLLTECGDLVHRGAGTCQLGTLYKRLGAAQNDEEWGFASLVRSDERNKTEPSPYTIPKPSGVSSDVQAPQTAPEPLPSPKGLELPQLSRPGAKSPRPVSEPTRRSEATGMITRLATPGFLFERATEVVRLEYVLNRFDQHCLPEGRGTATPSLPERCKSALRQSMKAYMRAYVKAWDKAYRGSRLTKLAKLTDGVLNWEHLAKRLRDDKNLVREVAGEFSESLQDIVRSVAMGNCTDEGTAWERSETDLQGWFSDVIGENWKTGKWVTGLLPPPAADKTPWGVMATGFKGTWDNLVRGIEGNYNLADRRDRGPEQFESIPWGSIEDLQTKYGLTDERLTKELLEFERWAGKLLDARLTELLIATQGAELGNLKPDPASGWPFLVEEKLAPNPLATVQYEKFKNLLREVEKTRVAFEKLESGLGKGEAPPGYKNRQAFYTACSRWQEFLKADTVDVTVVPCSVGQAPGGGWPQNIKSYCRDVADSIKLQLGGRGQLDFSCESQHWDDSKITWNFKELSGDWLVSINARSEQKSSDTKNAKDSSKVIHLVEKTKLQKLGEDSALALCAYLQRYGKAKDDRKTWYVVHGFDAEVGGAKPEAYGAVLRFDFGKTRLPEPIPKLEPVKTPEPPKWDDVSAGPG